MLFTHYSKRVTQLTATSPLRYVSDAEPGYQRQRYGRGFTYYHPDGKRVRDRSLRDRFGSLGIPPAWQSVWICVDEYGHLQSTGRDSAERKQYIYHPLWLSLREQRKFDKLIQFGEALPALRQQVSRDLDTPYRSRRNVLATAVALMDETLIRIGNEQYAAAHGTYGLTTLENEHVDLDKSKVTLDFVGKSGVEHEISFKNRKLANRIRKIQDLPGERLLQYVDDAGDVQGVDSADVNAYLRTQMGDQFSAKDFRTWGGSVLAYELLSTGEMDTTEAIKQVSQALGNTTAVCRKYYVHPTILERADMNTLPRIENEDDDHLKRAEFALLKLLKGE